MSKNFCDFLRFFAIWGDIPATPAPSTPPTTSNINKTTMTLSGSGRSPPPPTYRRIHLFYGYSTHDTLPIHTRSDTPPTNETEDDSAAADFLAALSPSTAKFLQKQNTVYAGQDNEQLRRLVRSLLGITGGFSRVRIRMHRPFTHSIALVDEAC
jgi:hypothetical protein